MIIIVKNIKSGIKIDNLVSFVKPAMKHTLFKRAEAKIESIKIFKLVDKNRRTVEYHGIIRITNDPEKKVLNHLKSRIKGNEQQIEEYVVRLWSNDRRLSNPESLAYYKDRRKFDRRRKGLKIVTVSEKPSTRATGVATELERNAIVNSTCNWDIVPKRRSSSSN